ncbi:helix-turn-helix domain-containing protein [Caldalkalibacillus salinus]|uniref:helix-turn-helix domain-containing protein n=1 Tax=Caldalkalibacillus salinus TaxID=2803787 RepID=UPI0019235370|nr:helix-turn-helix transcriptional regulator [Caldalkalibacillus salinus]
MLWGKDPKKRTKFGRFLDERDIYQKDFAEASGISNKTVSKLCKDPLYTPRYVQFMKIKKGFENLGLDPIEYEDFWW